MIEMIITSSILILIILLLRRLLGGNISMRLRYGLWLLVAVRLMMPLHVGNSQISVLNLLSDEGWHDAVFFSTEEEIISGIQNENYDRYAPLPIGPAMIEQEQTGASETDMAFEAKPAVVTGNTVLVIVWLAGILLTGAYMAWTQIRFVRYLRRYREVVPEKYIATEWKKRLAKRGVKVYQVKRLPSPCLVGRNIYVSSEMGKETDRLQYILAHEYCHAMQHDMLWSFLRSMLTTVYWFHPLVWVAAYAAKQDSELACDAGAIRLLGEQERYEYGRTLLYLLKETGRKSGYTGLTLTMNGKESKIRERIAMIAKKHSSKRWATVVVCMVMCISCGCAFTGATESNQDIKEINETGEEEGPDRKEMLSEETPVSTVEVPEANVLRQNHAVDQQAYSEYYLGQTDVCPLEDGTWYLLQNDASGISLYGLYTEKYGCYGIATLIGEDVNSFPEEWLPGYMMRSIKVLEWDKDGIPKTFAFRIRKADTSTSEIWKLYVADRYNTGNVVLYPFAESDYRKQFEERMEFSVFQESEKIGVICEGDMVVGEIDISAFADDVIEAVVWNGDPVGFMLDDEITMVTGIGLKLERREEVWYDGLPPLVFPVDIGEWGGHEITLGTPTVDQMRVVQKTQSLR